MEQFIEFATNNWMLVTAFVVLLILLLVHEAGRGGKALSPHQATMLVNHEDGVMLDIRDRKEFRAGHIAGAVNIPYANLKDRLGELEKYKDKPIVVVCKMGQTAGAAVKTLQDNGFTNATRLKGGMVEWQNSSLPLVTK